MNGVSCTTLQKRVITGDSEKSVRLTWKLRGRHKHLQKFLLLQSMKNSVFRRDEIWFAAENADHESEIYSLYEIRRENNERVNSTAAYDKRL